MRHPVHNVVHSELKGIICEVDREKTTVVGPFPVLSDVVVVVDDRHHSLRGIVVFKDAPVAGLNPHERMRKIQPLDLKKHLENRPRDIDLEQLVLGQRAPHLEGEDVT